ncbi:MAG: aminotransferase class V-fold PLP-dependent enzyme [Gemmatimonadaceae bacterium]
MQQLGAGLSYLEKIGVARIDTHLSNLTRKLRDGLLAQGFRLFTPHDNHSAIVAFYYVKPMAEVRAAFDTAKIDVTVREGHVRVSVGLFNNAEDIDRLLVVTQRMA